MKDLGFSASIKEKIEAKEGKYVVLDISFFYPDGKGGQVGDRGTIGGKKVLKVLEEGAKVLHLVEDFPDSLDVECLIDGERRQDASIQHTAQHILSQAIIRLYGYETVSFHMGEETSTIDINAKGFSEEQIYSSEELSNAIVLENRAVIRRVVSVDEIERYNLRKKDFSGDNAIVVEVDGFDVSLCGGTHVQYTGQIGLIKIVKLESVKKDLTRIHFLAGGRALRDYQRKFSTLAFLQKELTTGETEIGERILKMKSDMKSLSKELEEKRSVLTEVLCKSIEFENQNKPYILCKFEDSVKDILFPVSKRLSFSKKPSMIYHTGDMLTCVFCLQEGDKLSQLIEKVAIINARTWKISENCLAVNCSIVYEKYLEEVFLKLAVEDV